MTIKIDNPNVFPLVEGIDVKDAGWRGRLSSSNSAPYRRFRARADRCRASIASLDRKGGSAEQSPYCLRRVSGISFVQMYFLVQSEPEFGNDGPIAPVRNTKKLIRNQICAPAETAVHIAGEDKALFPREIGIVIAQVEIDVFLRDVTPAFQFKYAGNGKPPSAAD